MAGRLKTLFFQLGKNQYDPYKVRIVDTEQATPRMDGRNPLGYWYWAEDAEPVAGILPAITGQ